MSTPAMFDHPSIVYFHEIPINPMKYLFDSICISLFCRGALHEISPNHSCVTGNSMPQSVVAVNTVQCRTRPFGYCRLWTIVE